MDPRIAFVRHIPADEQGLRAQLSSTMYRAIRDPIHSGDLKSAWGQWMAILKHRISSHPSVTDKQRQAASYIVLLLKAHPDDARAEFTWRFRREATKGLPTPSKQRGLGL